MKKTILTLLVLAGLGTTASAEVKTDFVDVESFTDFTVGHGNETQAQKMFERELQRAGRLQSVVGKNRVLELTFTDIDMAGDIQPWRNRDNADIRYVESVYPPRMSFSYVLKDSDGKEIASGEDSIRDLSFDFGIQPISNYDSFRYEIEMLTDWARRTLPRTEG